VPGAPGPPPTAPPDVVALATTFGLDPAGAEVVRAASRHVVRFPASQVRTFAVPSGTSGPRQEAAVATLLAEAGVPAARRLAGPAPIEGWSVTAWREIDGAEAAAAPVGADVVGALAARLHRATGDLDPRGLVICDPLGAALEQLSLAVAAGATPEGELAVLRGEATRLEPVWLGAVDRARALSAGAEATADGTATGRGAILHGDLHPGNVVVGAQGPVLVDLELAGWGPRAYDAAPTVAFGRWYDGGPDEAAAFDAAYGAPLTAEATAAGLDEVWGLWSACWAVANRHRSAADEDEAAVRLATLATGTAPRPWRLR